MSDRAQLPRTLREELSDPIDVVMKLGLVDDRRRVLRQADGVLIACPVHEERTPSCSVRVSVDGTIACRCHGCGWTGDVLGLIATVHKLDVRREFATVLQRASELAGRTSLLEPRSRELSQRPRAATRDYPRREEIATLWSACGAVSDDAEARACLESRQLDPETVDLFGLARVVPRSAALPAWARFGRRSWDETGHRLLLPLFDAHGDLRSVRAWRVVDADTPKRLPPAGHRASELVLACSFGQAMLAGQLAEVPHPARVVVTEGEPDFLAWCTRFSDADESPPIVLGVLSGSWTEEIAARVPDGADVVIRTHADDAGERYAAEIARTLSTRCRVLRPKTNRTTDDRSAA